MKKILVIVASDDIVGGHSAQARTLFSYFSTQKVFHCKRYNIDRRLPFNLRKVPVLRTLVNELLYLSKLWSNVIWSDVLHIFSASYWSFILAPMPALIMGKILKKKIILNYHSGEADDHLNRWRVLVKPLLRFADEIVVPSDYLKNIFNKHGFSVKVISNSIDLNRFDCPKDIDTKGNGLRILCTRNFEPYYRVDLVVKAFRDIQKQVPDASLTLAGSGSKRELLEDLIQEYDLKNVNITGSVDNQKIHELYQNADLYMNASVLDNMPLSIMEAMASGLVIVSSDAGGIPYLIKNNHNGILVPSNSSTALADAVVNIYEDRDRWHRIRTIVRDDAKSFDNDVVCRTWEKLYAQLS